MDELTAKTNHTTLLSELSEFKTSHVENNTTEPKNYKELLATAKNFQKKNYGYR